MIQQKRLGRAVGLHSTMQIARELKIMMRHDAEAVAAAAASEPDRASGAPAGSFSPEAP